MHKKHVYTYSTAKVCNGTIFIHKAPFYAYYTNVNEFSKAKWHFE